MQEPTFQVRCATAPYQSIYRRSDSKHNIRTRLQMDLPRPWTSHQLGQRDFKPAKSRSLVVRKGNVTDIFRFSLVQILSITRSQLSAWEKYSTAHLGTQPHSNQLGRSCTPGLLQWTNQGYQESSKPWFISMEFVRDSSGHCWSTTSP